MYLEGMAESSIFVHIAINDITGKVSYPLQKKDIDLTFSFSFVSKALFAFL